MGIGKRFTTSACKSYEILVFVWVTWIIKVAIHFICVMNADKDIQKEIMSI